MATLIVSYPSADGSSFDYDYYEANHLPLVKAAWSDAGLVSAEGFKPADKTQPFVMIAVLHFADEASIDAALALPATAGVMGDIPKFTSISPLIFRATD